jgi:hypothetical protein
MVAPKAVNIRSVWSRLATGSMIVVMPAALRPAKRIADLTCAEATASLDAHPAERLDHPAHRPLHQRCIAGEGGGEGVAAGDPHGEADPGAGVAVVDDALRLEEAADAQSLDPPGSGIVARHRCPEAAHGRGGGEHVLAFEQSLDGRLADGKRAEHQGAVGNRLVAGRTDGAFQRPGACRAQSFLGVGRRHLRQNSRSWRRCPAPRRRAGGRSFWWSTPAGAADRIAQPAGPVTRPGPGGRFGFDTPDLLLTPLSARIKGGPANRSYEA